MKINKNIFLAKYTTFRIGGLAKYFLEAKNREEIIKAVKFAKSKKLPYFILGSGSNILVSDKGFNGVVIKITASRIIINNKIIKADAGVKLSSLLSFCLKNNLSGLEWLAGIPGTAGGAIYGNAGAFGHSMAELVQEVKILNNKLHDLKFSYRDSVFKKNKQIILSIKLKLKKASQKAIKEKIKKYLHQKKNTQPLSYASAGCIFKNPNKKPAGYLIDQCGLKGKKIGQAQISQKHANFIVNLGKAKAIDVKKLINLAKKEVKAQFNIDIKEEIQYLGF